VVPQGAGRGRLSALVRAHPVFTGLLLAGLALRVVTFFAYRPALIYFDSTRYLDRVQDLEPSPLRPIGYPAFLKLLPTDWELAVVPAVQHLFGLAIALLLYVLLRRLGVPKTWSALATAPVLLDGYQLNIEQYILSEALFELLLVSALVLILWRRPPDLASCAAAGLLLAGALLTRANAILVVVPALLALVFLGARWTRAAALAAAFVVPVMSYAVWYESVHGYYGLNGYGGQFLYARVAQFADCDGLELPARQIVLCEDTPREDRPTIDQYMWDNEISPLYDVELEPDERRSEVGGDFARRVILHQPFDYAEVVAEDFLFGFSPVKSRRDRDLPVSRWQFQEHYPVFREPDTTEILRADGYEQGIADGTLAPFLRTYQRFIYAWGPLLAIALVLGLLGAFGVGPARRSGLRTATFLFTFTALAVYLPSVAVSQFTWRYQLPLLVLLPPAGALGLAALTGRTAPKEARE
jgi:4-amino-4-deoxy-L-arabinose transferase-like glycosyltransferase